MQSLRIPVRVLVVIVVVGIELGQGSRTVLGADVPNERGDAARTGEQVGPGPTGSPVVLWETQTTEHEGGRVPQPVSASGVVLQAGGNQVVAFNLATGTELWRRDEVEDVSPAITGDIAVIPSRYGYEQGYFYGLDLQTGEERWRFEAKDTPAAVSPVAADGIVYVLSWETTGRATEQDTFLFAVDAATGRQRWRYEVKGLVTSTPAVGSSVVVLGKGSGIAAVRLTDGKEAWRYESDQLVAIAYSAIAAGMVLGTTPTGMNALDEESGDRLWETDLYDPSRRNPQGEAPAASEELAYSVGSDRTLRALRLTDGAELWTYEDAWSAPVIAAGILYVSESLSGLTALDATTGDLLWSVPLSVNGVGVSGVSPPALVGGIAFVGVESHVGTHIFALTA